MGKFPTYGMAGIGIAAAIGFVFALTFLNNNPTINPELAEQQSQDPPSFQQMRDSDSQDAAKMQAEDQGQSAQLMMQQEADLRPTLASVMVLDANTEEVIGELVPQMQFLVNEPVLIQVNFVSQNAVANHLITLGIKNNSGNSSELTQLAYEDVVNLRGNIGADSNFKLELYWNPASTGNYTLLLFSANPHELAAESAQPIIEVPIEVVTIYD